MAPKLFSFAFFLGAASFVSKASATINRLTQQRPKRWRSGAEINLIGKLDLIRDYSGPNLSNKFFFRNNETKQKNIFSTKTRFFWTFALVRW